MAQLPCSARRFAGGATRLVRRGRSAVVGFISGDVAVRDAEGAVRIREASLPVEFAERVARLTAATKESASRASPWPEAWMMRPRRGESRIIPI